MNWPTAIVLAFLGLGLMCGLVVVFRNPVTFDGVALLGVVFVVLAIVAKAVWRGER